VELVLPRPRVLLLLEHSQLKSTWTTESPKTQEKLIRESSIWPNILPMLDID